MPTAIQPKPKYILKGPRQEKVERVVYSKKPEQDLDGNILRDDAGKPILGPLEYETVEEVRNCWRLYIPHGPNGEMNSIRITSEAQLKELGLDGDVPLIDPETGETVGSFAQRVSQDYGPDPVMTKPKAKSASDGE